MLTPFISALQSQQPYTAICGRVNVPGRTRAGAAVDGRHHLPHPGLAPLEDGRRQLRNRHTRVPHRSRMGQGRRRKQDGSC